MGLLDANSNKKKKWWENLSPITERIVIISLMVAILAVGSVLVVQNMNSEREINNTNNKTLYELVGYNKNVEVLLSKSIITSTSEQSTHLLADIWRQADLAKQNLEALPLPQETLQDVSGYLAQTSDFSYALMRKTINGEKVTKDEYETLKSLHEYSQKMNDILMNIYNQSNKGDLSWKELKKASEDSIAGAVPASTSGMQDLTKTMQDYEGLIYDGAFSNHISSMKPKYLSDNIVDNETAKQNMLKYLDEARIEKIELVGENNGNLPTYSFTVKYKDQKDVINIDMTKQDGVLLWMLYNRDVTQRNLDVEKCKQIAKDYLNNIGFKNMKDTYYSIEGNMITVNLAYEQNNVLCYPDLIKVKLAMDNGEICGVETHGFLYNHEERALNDIQISMEKAKKVINDNVEIKSQRLALIPTDWQGEVLVYEFQGFIDDRNFLVYINAKTGIEEKILLVIDNKNGILTM